MHRIPIVSRRPVGRVEYSLAATVLSYFLTEIRPLASSEATAHCAFVCIGAVLVTGAWIRIGTGRMIAIGVSPRWFLPCVALLIAVVVAMSCTAWASRAPLVMLTLQVPLMLVPPRERGLQGKGGTPNSA
jgi:hypothetical protein